MSKVNNNMLIEVQKQIHGQRNEKLTPIEVNKLFHTKVTPEFNLVIYRALQRKALDPDVAILQAISRAITKDYLISIALCLRFGADANMYVNAPQVGTIHILGYVYNLLAASGGQDRFTSTKQIADEVVLNTIVLMLLIKGARPSMSMFDRQAGRIRTTTEPNISPTVIQWLNDQGYTTILNEITTGDKGELTRFVNPESLVILSILLDNPSLTSRPYQPEDMLLAIRAFSSTDSIPIPETKTMMDFQSLNDAVTYLNGDAYEKLLKRGQLPSYVMINRLIILMRANKDHPVVAQELEHMLLSSIMIGTPLDQDQLNIISTFGRDVLSSIMKEYEKPYWRKISGTTGRGPIPHRLRHLAISLNIDDTMSQSAICEQISALAAADKEALKEAARRRQQLRIASDLGTMNEFINGKTPTLVCRNKALLPHDPLDYNDIDLAYYRDDQGAVWCFGSDSFSSLLESGVNPYNSARLPEMFKEQVRYRLAILKHIDDYHTPLTFTKAIDSLTDKDTINEKSSVEAVNTFIQLGGQNGITAETIRSLTKDQMMAALRSVGYPIDLQPLSTAHALVTTAHVVVYISQSDTTLLRPFFDAI